MNWSAQFDWDGLTGDVQVECVPIVDPAAYATVADDVVGFPACTAWVRYPRRGYHSMFGWVQLVRSTDNASHGDEFASCLSWASLGASTFTTTARPTCARSTR
jgi:hypothetical protein